MFNDFGDFGETNVLKRIVTYCNILYNEACYFDATPS
jgi:hypothetical protein